MEVAAFDPPARAARARVFEEEKDMLPNLLLFMRRSMLAMLGLRGEVPRKMRCFKFNGADNPSG